MENTFTTFKELKYERPDVKQLKKDIARLLGEFNSAKSFEEADAAFLEFMHIIEG